MRTGYDDRAARVEYRTDIDGLRALAVLSVVAYHAFPHRLPGGFSGVDVFFVISGFLITSQILSQARAGTFSVAGFYARRILRIFPALLVVGFACAAVAPLVLLPLEARALGRELAAGAGFVSNLLFWSETGYFERQAWLKPLLHLWSLGVEEQYYLAWPLFLALLLPRSRAALGAAIVALLLASFAACAHFSYQSAPLAFYMPFTRLWELMLGGALAVFALPLGAAATAAAGVGLVLIVSGLFLISAQSAFPGFWALLPTAGTALAIAAGPHNWFARRLLSHPWLVAIGLISYPLYLWHWPILSFIQIEYGEVAKEIRLAAITASVLLAWGTYRLVEAPVRFGSRSRRVVAALAALMLVLGLGGVALALRPAPPAERERDAFMRSFENDAPRFAYFAASGIPEKYGFECNFYDGVARRAKAEIPSRCTTRKYPDAPAVMLWGDSHAYHLRYGLERALPPGIALLQVTTSACRPQSGDQHPDPLGACNASNRLALQTVQREKPRVVILAQSSGHESTDWEALAAAIKAAGAQHVVLIGPVPTWQPYLNRIMARHYWGNFPRRTTRGLQEAPRLADRTLARRFAGSAGITYVSLIDKLCNGEGCLTYAGEDPIAGLMAFDHAHFTPLGSEYVARSIVWPAVTSPTVSR